MWLHRPRCPWTQMLQEGVQQGTAVEDSSQTNALLESLETATVRNHHHKYPSPDRCARARGEVNATREVDSSCATGLWGLGLVS